MYDKEDRTIHLDAEERIVCLLCCGEYRQEHRTVPACVVSTRPHLIVRRRQTASLEPSASIALPSLELLYLSKSFTRLFRNGVYPPLRGTFLTLDDRTHILYTRGSVDVLRDISWNVYAADSTDHLRSRRANSPLLGRRRSSRGQK